MPTSKTVFLDGFSLSLEDIWEIAHGAKDIGIDEACIQRLEKARALVDELAQSGQPVYGINTGFGFFSGNPHTP
jgi:histidine ammonia-lyase